VGEQQIPHARCVPLDEFERLKARTSDEQFQSLHEDLKVLPRGLFEFPEY